MPALAVTLCFLLLCAAAAPLLAQDTAASAQPLRLAVVNEDADPRMDKLLRFMTGGGLFDELLHISYAQDSSAALALLQNHAADGVLVLPRHFLQSFLSGENLSARLVTALSAPAESLALSQLVPAAEELLEIGQGGVWAALSLPQVQKLSPDAYNALYREINLTLLQACLSAAQDHITPEALPLTGTLMPLLPHYFTVFYIFFALLSGCFFVRLFTADKQKGLLRRLASLGVGPVAFLLPKLLFFFLYQLGMGFCVLFFAGGLFPFAFSVQGIAGVVIFSLLTAAVCLFFFTALDMRGAVLGLVLLGFLGLFCTGGLLPPTYLPAVFPALGACLPAGLAYRLLAPLCGAGVSPWWLLAAAAVSLVLFLLCVFSLEHIKKEGAQ